MFAELEVRGRADSAQEQDLRALVGAGAEDHFLGVDLPQRVALVDLDADRAAPLEQEPGHVRVGLDASGSGCSSAGCR